jgi:hypothetical protein
MGIRRMWMHVAGLCLMVGIASHQGEGGQEQPSGARANWPCGARIDPTYFQLAEATGGDLRLVAPGEMPDPASFMQAFDSRSRTIFRLAGAITAGPYEFRVPIDPSVESVTFSIWVQCLQRAEVSGPSGEPVTGDGAGSSASVAERRIAVAGPAPGIWTIRVAGSGLAGVTVKARSALGIEDVEFGLPGGASFGPLPTAAVENVVKITVSGRPAHIEAALVDAASKEVAPLALTPLDGGTYVARFTPGSEAFRVLIRGQDAGGVPFQRVHAPLIAAR